MNTWVCWRSSGVVHIWFWRCSYANKFSRGHQVDGGPLTPCTEVVVTNSKETVASALSGFRTQIILKSSCFHSVEYRLDIWCQLDTMLKPRCEELALSPMSVGLFVMFERKQQRHINIAIPNFQDSLMTGGQHFKCVKAPTTYICKFARATYAYVGWFRSSSYSTNSRAGTRLTLYRSLHMRKLWDICPFAKGSGSRDIHGGFSRQLPILMPSMTPWSGVVRHVRQKIGRSAVTGPCGECVGHVFKQMGLMLQMPCRFACVLVLCVCVCLCELVQLSGSVYVSRPYWKLLAR